MGKIFSIFESCACNTTIESLVKEIKDNHLVHLDQKIEKIDDKVNRLQQGVVQLLTHCELVPIRP